VVDERGVMTHNTDGRASGGDFSGRDYFRHHRDNAQSGFFISNPQRSMFTNNWFIAASHAVRGPAGEFRGVVLAVLELEYFGRYWQLPAFGKDFSVALFRNDGTLLMRSPYNEEAIGKSYRHAYVWHELMPKQDAGAYRASSAIDDVSKIFAFGRVQEYPGFTVIVGISESYLLQQWRIFAAISLGAFLIFIGAVLVFVFVLLRQLHARLASQRHAATLARYPLQNLNPVMTVARDGTRLFMNDAARSLVKSTRGSIAAGQLDAAVRAMAAETAAGTREIALGPRLWSASYAPQPAGHCDLYLTDITAARQGEELQRLFFDLPFIGMAITSPDTGRWLRFNDRLCEILGYSREELQQ
jgi:PAS domain-containing protein